MDVQQISILEALSISGALFLLPKSKFLWLVFIHVCVFSAVVNILNKILIPEIDYTGYIAFYFYLGSLSFMITLLFFYLKTFHCTIVGIAVGIQSMLCFYLAFAGIEMLGVFIPSIEYIGLVGNFINANIVMIELLAAFHYAGLRHKEQKWW